MSASPASLDLSATRYALTVNGKTYGPYAAGQMMTYIGEGRVTAASIVSREGGPWMPASDDPSLAGAFLAKTAQAAEPLPAPVATPAPQPVPAKDAEGTGKRTEPATARDLFLKELEGVRALKTPAFAAAPGAVTPIGERRRTARNATADLLGEDEQKASNFLLIYDLKSRGHNKLEDEILSLDGAAKVFPGVWVISGPYTAGSLRNRLIHHFGTLDSLFIVDASRDKLAWFNLGPEADACIRKTWRRS